MCSIIVIAHGGITGMPMGMISSWNLADTATLQPLGLFNPNQVNLNCLSPKNPTSWSFANGGKMGMPMEVIRAPEILWMLELCNHLGDSLQIKFFGTVLACRCTKPWSFAPMGIMGMPMGVIKFSWNLVDAGTQQPPG